MWTLPWGERENIGMFWVGNLYDEMYVLEIPHWLKTREWIRRD